MRTILSVCATLAITFALASCSSVEAAREVSIIPVPASVELLDGQYTLRGGSTIGVEDSSLVDVARYMATTIERSVGLKLEVVDGAKADIVLRSGLQNKNNEAYVLTVDRDGVSVECRDPRGAIMAVATFEQLLPLNADKGAKIPYVKIVDEPRFAYRGLMLDVARHFQDVESVKHVLDLMARYKLNKFHWHLTDDQGWRIEIKQYPELTTVGAWRKWNWQDRECMDRQKMQDNSDFALPGKYIKIEGADTLYGGFYTQDQIREVVAYAAQRGIDVLPEIDMPGHMLAAIGAYPSLSCNGKAQWGVGFSEPLCLGNDSTIVFAKNVYTEIVDLFPYEYMHLGADEVERTTWSKCAKCNARIKAEKLQGVEHLQAWFVHDMERHFNSLGKKLIGWDEIIEGGLSPTATIMWWRDWAPTAVSTATAAGNKVIMSPCFNLYLDALESRYTFENTYNWEPISADLSSAEAANILGVQGNLWAEYVPSMRRVEHQYFPRLLALSEIGWSNPSKKNWGEFFTRVVRQIEWLDAHGVNYRIPDLTGFENVNAFTDTASVWVECSLPNIEVRYTTDGSFPTVVSPRLDKPIHLDKTTSFIFRGFRPDGTAGEMFRSEYRKEGFAAPIDTTLANKGLVVRQYEYKGESCAEIEKARFVKQYVLDSLNLGAELQGWVGLVGQGFFEVPSDGIYTFALKSNDGSMLYVDGAPLIDNDTPHGDRELTAQKALGAGLHTIRVEFFDMNNGGSLRLKINGEVFSGFSH